MIYGSGFMADHLAQLQGILAPVVVGAGGACISSFVGKRLLQKVTMRTVQLVVAMAMLLIGAGLAAGLF